MTAPRLETVAQLAGFENIFDATVTAVHEDRGTMVCQLAGSKVELETPLVRADVGSSCESESAREISCWLRFRRSG